MARISVQANAEAVHDDLAADDASDRRRFERTDLIVRVDYSTIDELFSEFTRDINEGGLFIETDTPRPIGTVVSMQFALPGSGQPIQGTGTVVWHSEGGDGRGRGMGIEFDELDASARERIDEMIRALRREG